MKRNLKDFTDEEILSELEKREGANRRMRPAEIEKPDLTVLIEYCREYLNELESAKRHMNSDWPEWFFEAAMIACYGGKIFDYINSFEGD